VDEEVGRIIRTCHKQATDILTQNREGLNAIAEVLFEKETLDADEFAGLFRQHVGEIPEK